MKGRRWIIRTQGRLAEEVLEFLGQVGFQLQGCVGEVLSMSNVLLNRRGAELPAIAGKARDAVWPERLTRREIRASEGAAL